MKFEGRRPNQPRAAARGHQHDDADRLRAHADLMGHLGWLTLHGAAIPCLVRRDVWTASDDTSQQAAARACLDCPALAACRAYVDTYPEPEGVWAGQTPKQRTKSQRKANHR